MTETRRSLTNILYHKEVAGGVPAPAALVPENLPPVPRWAASFNQVNAADSQAHDALFATQTTLRMSSYVPFDSPDGFNVLSRADWGSLIIGPGQPIQSFNRRAAGFPPALREQLVWPADQPWLATLRVRTASGLAVDIAISAASVTPLSDEAFDVDGRTIELTIAEPFQEFGLGLILQNNSETPWTVRTLVEGSIGEPEGDFTLIKSPARREDRQDFEEVILDETGQPLSLRETSFLVRWSDRWRPSMIVAESNVWDGSRPLWQVRSVVDLRQNHSKRLVCEAYQPSSEQIPVNVQRPPAGPSADSSLSNLVVVGQVLDPVFAADQQAYTVDNGEAVSAL